MNRVTDEVDPWNCRQDKFEKDALPGVAPSLNELPFDTIHCLVLHIDANIVLQFFGSSALRPFFLQADHVLIWSNHYNVLCLA